MIGFLHLPPMAHILPWVGSVLVVCVVLWLLRVFLRRGMGVRESFAWWYWLWVNKQWWFLRVAPHAEISTRIYEGLPGSGKTLLMVADCIELMRDGVLVYSNVAICDPLTGMRALPLGGWLDMLRASVKCLEAHSAYQGAVTAVMEAGGGQAEIIALGKPRSVVFAFDEIHLAADARAWQSTPAWWLNLMAQRRHYSVGLLGTTQDLSTVEKRLRMLVGRVVQVRPSLFRRYWKRLPLFIVQDLDMSVRGEGVGDAVGRGSFTWVKSHGFHGYSTREIMASVDFADLKSEEATAEVAALTERAIAAAGVEFSTSFLEEYADGATSVTVI